MAQWTRRQVLAQMGIAAAAVHTLDPHELCCTVAAHAQTADKDLFELKKVGDGVYAAVAATRYKVNCNAAVIMTDDGVIVVDTHSKPSASRAVYQQIQGITKKPVIKVINTHFHWDHWQGNESYAAQNPKMEIITSEKTKENMSKPDAGVGGVPYIEKQIANLPGEIDTLKADIVKETDAAKKKNLEANLLQAESFLQELKSMKPALPTRTVATTLTLKEAGREIQLHALGRGHTNGDLYIYLPKEKVVATGDALIDWMPFLNDGYPEVSQRPHRRREEGVGRRRHARRDADEDRRSARAEVRGRHVEAHAGPVSRSRRTERRDGSQKGGFEGLRIPWRRQ
ncbi:MAG: hypothetical protein DMD97_13235, partial [Candidatus Rokuibacteriota bacterium]